MKRRKPGTGESRLNQALARRALDAMQVKRRKLYQEMCDGMITRAAFQRYNRRFAAFLDAIFDVLHPRGGE